MLIFVQILFNIASDLSTKIRHALITFAMTESSEELPVQRRFYKVMQEE